MSTRNIDKSISSAQSLAPAARTASANGTGVDLLGFQSAVVLIDPGTLTDGVHTPSLEESDASGSGYAAVAAADMSGSFAAIASNVIQEVGYIGRKRYIRAVITTTGSPSTGVVAAATIIRTQPVSLPQ